MRIVQQEPTTSATSTATTMRIYMSFPAGKPIRGRVKELRGIDVDPSAHRNKRHQWREMLHFGQPGTGFAECFCGAFGVPYRLPHEVVIDAARAAIATMRARVPA